MEGRSGGLLFAHPAETGMHFAYIHGARLHVEVDIIVQPRPSLTNIRQGDLFTYPALVRLLPKACHF